MSRNIYNNFFSPFHKFKYRWGSTKFYRIRKKRAHGILLEYGAFTPWFLQERHRNLYRNDTVVFTGTTRGGIWPKMEHSTFSWCRIWKLLCHTVIFRVPPVIIQMWTVIFRVSFFCVHMLFFTKFIVMRLKPRNPVSGPIPEHEKSRFWLLRNKFVIAEAVLSLRENNFFYIKVSKRKEQLLVTSKLCSFEPLEWTVYTIYQLWLCGVRYSAL